MVGGEVFVGRTNVTVGDGEGVGVGTVPGIRTGVKSELP
jgi:hypothetical protein